MSLTRRIAVLAGAAALCLGASAPAQAQPNVGVQEGLVNIAIVDVLNDNQVVVQVPIGVAANVCGVAVGVIADQETGATVCEAETTQEQPIRLL